ncbi:MAG TPA: TraR/DksA C4-type zinc finger protein, partial [Bacteroidia bacterium]|nr:TraR/DksA C4-type zinc finger protein [Bacteroidia bacterium]
PAPAKAAPAPKKTAKAAPAAKPKATETKPLSKSTKKDSPKKETQSTKSVAAAPAKTESAKTSPKSSTTVKIPPKKRTPAKRRPLFAHLSNHAPSPVSTQSKEKPKKLSPAFLKAQRQRLLDLRDSLVDQMSGVARDSLGRGEDSSDSSAFGMHQADAGSDAYDRDFALNILSQEQNALYEIEEALVRIESGEYGICQGSGELIPQARLEALPFARCTVEFQEKLDQEQSLGHFRAPVTSLFGLEEKEVAKPSDEEDD